MVHLLISGGWLYLMGSWLFWGIVLLGGLLIGLGLDQMFRRKTSASPASKRSHRVNSITDSMQVKRVRKPSSVSQNTNHGQSRNRGTMDEAGPDRHSQSQKSTASRSATPRHPSNPSMNPVVMRGRKYSQKGNPATKPTEMPAPRRKQLYVEQPPNSPSSREIDPAFEETQIRRVRRPKSVNNPTSSVPTPQADGVDEQTAMRRPSRRAKPSNSTNPKDLAN